MNQDVLNYIRGSVVGLIGKGATLLSGYGTIWLLNRIFTQNGYGSFTTTIAVISLVGLVSQLGLRQSTIQRVSEISVEEEQIPPTYVGSVFFWTVAVSVVAAVVFALLAPYLASVLGESGLTKWFVFSAIVIPGMSLRAVQGGVLRGLEQVDKAILLEQIIPSVIRVIGLLAVVVTSGGILAVVLVIASTYYASVVIYLYTYRNWWPIRPYGIESEHWRYSLTLLVNSLLSQMVRRSNVILLTALATLSVTAGFKVALQVAAPAKFIDTILTSVLQPRISKFVTRNDFEGLVAEFSIVRNVSMAFGILAIVFVLYFGQYVLGVFGAYESQYPILLLLVAGGGVLNTCFGPIGQILLMGKHSRSIMSNSFVSLIVVVSLNVILIPKYGVLGAVIAVIVGDYFLTNAIGVWQVRRTRGWLVFDTQSVGVALLTFCGLSAYLAGVLGRVSFTSLLIAIFAYNTYDLMQLLRTQNFSQLST